MISILDLVLVLFIAGLLLLCIGWVQLLILLCRVIAELERLEGGFPDGL